MVNDRSNSEDKEEYKVSIDKVGEDIKKAEFETITQLINCITSGINKLKNLSLDPDEVKDKIKSCLRQNINLAYLIERLGSEEVVRTIRMTIDSYDTFLYKVRHRDGEIEEFELKREGDYALPSDVYEQKVDNVRTLDMEKKKPDDELFSLEDAVAEKEPLELEKALELEREMQEEAKDPWIGETIFGYVIKEILGKGGMGMVYEGRDPRTNRKVAIKRILSKDEIPMINGEEYNNFIKRFSRERKIIVPLSKKNENIVKIEISAEKKGLPFYIMEYLGASIPKKARSLEEAVGIIIQASAALHVVHNVEFSYTNQNGKKMKIKGIAHRDIKPGNILQKHDATIKLTDFGLAKPTKIGERLDITQLGVVMGTPQYMSPEQIKGKEVDTKTDVFSLGIVFYELLTGESPWELDERSIGGIHDLYSELLKYSPKLLRQAKPSFIKQRKSDKVEISSSVDDIAYSMLQPDRIKRVDATYVLNSLIDLYKSQWEEGIIFEPTLNRAFEIIEKEEIIN